MTIFKADRNRRLRELLAALDIPPSLYEQAAERYLSLRDWFKRPESAIREFDPAVYPQGSFRLGTVIRPLTPDEEYDLDVVCQLMLLKKTTLTQRQLKELVGAEVKAYAKAKGIKAPVVERKRAWRLDYADGVSFHIDVLPCVPEDGDVIRSLISDHGVDRDLAASAVALTCRSHPLYAVATTDWPTSNPVGYGTWFERRMKVVADERRRQLVKEGRYESVEKVPVYELKTPLQRSGQLLKRHRDSMFRKSPELKPISMIITTLAALAYGGEDDLDDALRGILERMPQHVHDDEPRVPNPVNPGEDFADKWAGKPELETNFWAWHKQACRDFGAFTTEQDPKRLVKIAEDRFAVALGEDKARALTGSAIVEVSPPKPAVTAPHVIVRNPPEPWADGGSRRGNGKA